MTVYKFTVNGVVVLRVVYDKDECKYKVVEYRVTKPLRLTFECHGEFILESNAVQLAHKVMRDMLSKGDEYTMVHIPTGEKHFYEVTH